MIFLFFFFNDTATTEIYTLSLHDALPILLPCRFRKAHESASNSSSERLPGTMVIGMGKEAEPVATIELDRKSTRLNSSHSQISYAVFCLKKKNRTSIAASLSKITRHW